MKVVRYTDRPDLRERRFEELTKAYMNENEPGNLYWDRLYTDFPDYQVALVDGDQLLAEAHAIPLSWDGSLDLPSGWDEGFVHGMTSDRPHHALMAIAISVAPSQQGRWPRMIPEGGSCAAALPVLTLRLNRQRDEPVLYDHETVPLE